MSELAPRLTVTVDPRTTPAPKVHRGQALLYGAVAVWMLVTSPVSMGLFTLLPLAFAYLGYRAVRRPREAPYTVRVFDEVMEIEEPFCVARTALQHIHKVVENTTHLLVQMPGGDLAIPLSQLGGDRRVLLDALPSHVSHELAPPPPDPRRNARRTLLLWLVLVVAFIAIYSVMGAR
jgi:hypothetical protein